MQKTDYWKVRISQRKIITENLVIEGNVDGDIKVKDHLTIYTTGRTSEKFVVQLILTTEER